MTLKNEDLAKFFHQIADFYEINAENPYRIKAYRRAAYRISTLSEEVAVMVASGRDLTEIPGIGKNIASYIQDILKTNSLPALKLRPNNNPKAYNQLKRIAGLGKKRLAILHNELNIYTKEELLKAIEQGEELKKAGFSEVLQKKMLESLQHPKPYERTFKLNVARRIANFLIERIKSIKGVNEVLITGQVRRALEAIDVLHLLIITDENLTNLLQEILALPEFVEILEQSETSAALILKSGVKVLLSLIVPQDKISALIQTTGSAEHIKQLQKITKKSKINSKKIVTENDFYQQLNMQYIPPELRENRGEIEASQAHQLPKLIELNDIKGDLHTHTTETDGTETLLTMVKAAIRHGYQYYAITDHSQRLRITNGLTKERLLAQIDEINRLNEKLPEITILKSIEVDILEDGSLDLPDDVLAQLDIRVCSVHSKFKLSEEKQTERIIRAMDNPYFNILGHATGRLITSRPPYAINIEKIMQAAKERNCLFELNSQPSRLDIKDVYCIQAKKMGLKFSISSDAHSIGELDYLKYGIEQARRAWLEAKDVINTYSLSELKKIIKRI